MKFEPDSKLKSDGSNFYLWKDLEETILIGNRWFEHVDGSSVAPNRETDRTRYSLWRQVDNLAKGQLSFNMDSSLYQELRVGVNCAADLWAKVNVRFGTENTITQNKVIVELRSKRIGATESVKDHIFQLRKLKADCIDSGVILSDKEWHAIAVASFKGHTKWETVAAMGSFIAGAETLLQAMEAQDTGPTLASDTQFTSVNSQLLHNAMATAQQNSMFVGRNRPTRQANNCVPCPNCHRGYHTIENCWAPGGGAVDKRPPGYHVPTDLLGRERAHLAELRRELERRSNNQETAQSAKLSGETNRHFMMAAIESQPLKSSGWLIDSGATSHFVNDRAAFETYLPIAHSNVGMPDGHLMNAEGSGNVRLLVRYNDNPSEIVLRDVVHVPNMVNNLVSVKKLLRDGIIPSFTPPDGCILTRYGIAIADTSPIGELWELNSVVIAHKSALTSTRRDTFQTLEMWHRRLAHM